MLDLSIDQFLISDYDGLALLDEGNKIVDATGLEISIGAQKLRPASLEDEIRIFEYMKRRIFDGDLVCSTNNLATNRERWWVVGKISPAFNRVYSTKCDFSCMLEHAIPLKSLDIEFLFEDDLDYERWLTEIASLELIKRLKANNELISRVSDYMVVGEHATDYFNKLF